MTATPSPQRRLRTDAARNRTRIVDAAREAFAARGLDVPLEDVASHAGVGIGTVYRRFPTRDDLIAACFERRVEEYARAAEEALEAPDGWTGLVMYAERICAMQAADRGLRDVLTQTFPNAAGLEGHRSRGYALSVRLLDRAKSEGSLRPDIVPEDIVVLLMANAGVVQGAGSAAPQAWRRHVALVLEGMRAPGTAGLPPAPSPRRIALAMRRLGSNVGHGERR